MAEIIIDILPDGEVKMEGNGYQGKSCDEAMAHFEKSLGVVSNRKNKPEYYQGVRTNAGQRA
jgi:transposase